MSVLVLQQRSKSCLTDSLDFLLCAGQKARDLRNWLTIYSYWNQGGQDNVATMLLYLVDQYLASTGIAPKPLQETPPTGLVLYLSDYHAVWSNRHPHLRLHFSILL